MATKTKKIALLGFDREGRSTLKFLRRLPECRGAEIWILDKSKNVQVPKGMPSRLGPDYLKNLDDFDIVFRTPGAPYLLPEIQRARRGGTRISSATKLFFEYCPATIVGITGTKGKGTTATLLYKILKAARRDAYLAGNVGVPALDIIPKLSKRSIVVLELSSFQLQDLERSPAIAAVLDLFPDHQDSHKDLKEYYAAKARIAHFQKPDDKVFFLKSNRLSAAAARNGRGKKMPVDETRFTLFGQSDLSMPGPHNFKNAVMASTIARALGVPTATIKKAVRKFPGTEHRLELVRRLGRALVYNDSASTNPQTSAAAIKAFPGHPKVLIAGGRDKNLDYAPLADALKESRMKAVILFGENKQKIRRAIAPALKASIARPPIVFAKDLRGAVSAAARIASGTNGTSRPPVILFSPGSTSFDMFKNYAHRGEEFKRIVRQLRSDRPHSR